MIEKEKQKILFSIPDFDNFYRLNMLLISLMKSDNDKFYDDVVIDSVYGTFPGCIWNSGRISWGGTTLENIQNVVKEYNKKGISIRYTFTNSTLKPEHLNDYICNRILEVTGNLVEGVRNGVTVNLDILAEHIQKNYPDFYLVWSTTRGINTIEDINKFSKDRMLVPYYGINNTPLLEQLEHPENIEILVSEACIENCPNRQFHYKLIGESQSLQGIIDYTCPHGCEEYFYYEAPVNRKHYVTIQNIREKYLPLGINKFKISGRRDDPINVIENYVNYFVKPEYRDLIRNKFLILYFKNRNR